VNAPSSPSTPPLNPPSCDEVFISTERLSRNFFSRKLLLHRLGLIGSFSPSLKEGLGIAFFLFPSSSWNADGHDGYPAAIQSLKFMRLLSIFSFLVDSRIRHRSFFFLFSEGTNPPFLILFPDSTPTPPAVKAY